MAVGEHAITQLFCFHFRCSEPLPEIRKDLLFLLFVLKVQLYLIDNTEEYSFAVFLCMCCMNEVQKEKVW